LVGWTCIRDHDGEILCRHTTAAIAHLHLHGMRANLHSRWRPADLAGLRIQAHACRQHRRLHGQRIAIRIGGGNEVGPGLACRRRRRGRGSNGGWLVGRCADGKSETLQGKCTTRIRHAHLHLERTGSGWRPTDQTADCIDLHAIGCLRQRITQRLTLGIRGFHVVAVLHANSRLRRRCGRNDGRLVVADRNFETALGAQAAQVDHPYAQRVRARLPG
jgi:hypothetical protein